MEARKQITQITTEHGLRVTRVIHENGHEAVTLDTGAHPILRLVTEEEELRTYGRQWP